MSVVAKLSEFLASNKNDFTRVSEEERQAYLAALCETLGLNPMLIPFEFIKLDGKLTCYAKKACTDQLRSIHGISVVELHEEERNGVQICRVKLRDKEGREDCDVGSVSLYDERAEIWVNGKKSPNPNMGKRIPRDAEANAIMKAATKAKRRATLSMCGLGMLDESEVETIVGAVVPGSEAPPVAKEPPATTNEGAKSTPATTNEEAKPKMPLSKNVATNIQHNILGAMEQKRDAWASPDEMADVVKIALERHEYTPDQFTRLMQPLRYEWYRQAAIHADSDVKVEELTEWLRNDLVRQQLGTGPADALLACLQQSGEAAAKELAKLSPKYR